MANLLYLVHRLPYPPNKGDKVRSYHLLKHLARSHRVHLGTFIDDPDDARHLDAVREFCTDLHVARLDPRVAKIKSVRGLLTGEALTLPYYRDPGLQAWVDRTLAEEGIDAVVVFSGAMAQYVPKSGMGFRRSRVGGSPVNRLDSRYSGNDEYGGHFPILVDFVDVDSAKWTQYAPNHRWPMSWLYRREGERLLAFERQVAATAARSFFVTDNEADLFRGLAPESAGRVEAMENGVDSDYFSPGHDLRNPYPPSGKALVFTGAMDYWPNVDAVTWFAAEVLPSMRARWPDLTFYIVGRSPTPAVQALAGEGVVVTGTVPDVRPYLRHADVVVAPLRVARGIQNKILEAMAMARPVVASAACADAIEAEAGEAYLAAESASDFATLVDGLLAEPERSDAIGRAARQRVIERYSWEAHLGSIDRHLVKPGLARNGHSDTAGDASA